MPPSPDSSKRLNRISKRKEKAFALYRNPPASTLPEDSAFPLTYYGDLVSEEKAATTWGEFQDWVGTLGPPWSFRGQSKENWRLLPGLERRIIRTRTVSSADGKRGLTQTGMFPGRHEQHLFQQFQNTNHDPINLAPSNGALDWLALMQHHGAPTRLLDWTRCPYVALYFALRDAERECAVWAIDMEWVEQTSAEVLRKHDPRYPDSSDLEAVMQYVNSMLFEEHTSWNSHPVVMSLTPVASIERMKAQHGHFLRSLSYNHPFDLSLFWMIRSKFKEPWVANRPLRKLIITPCQRTELLEELRRMKIDEGSLFPGSDTAKYLRAELETGIKREGRAWRKTTSLMLNRGVLSADTTK